MLETPQLGVFFSEYRLSWRFMLGVSTIWAFYVGNTASGRFMLEIPHLGVLFQIYAPSWPFILN